MKKITLIGFMTLVSTLSYSNSKTIYNSLDNKGLTKPDSGVTVVPIKQISSLSKDLTSLWTKQDKEQKEHGFYFELTPRPKELLNLNKDIIQHFKEYEGNNTPTSTHMRHKIEEIHTAYAFKVVPTSDVANVIGFAPVGGYKNGWTGVVEYFDAKSIGSCAYTENNMKLSHGAERVAEEMATYDINGKITTIDIKGSSTTGFLYTIYWSDNEYFRQLECANMKYSKLTTDEVIALAKRIDAQ